MEQEELIKKNIQLNRRKIIADIILIIVIVAISIYVIYNIESFKTLSQDVCRLCELKTNATCRTYSFP